MSFLDIIILIPLLFGIGRGVYKGFVKSLVSLVGIIAGVYMASLFSPLLSGHLCKWFVLTASQSYVISFIILFVSSILLFHLIAFIIDKFLKVISLAWVNRLLGALFGLVKYVLLVSVVLNLMTIVNSRANIIDKKTIKESVLYRPIEKIVPTILPYVTLYIDETISNAKR